MLKNQHRSTLTKLHKCGWHLLDVWVVAMLKQSSHYVEERQMSKQTVPLLHSLSIHMF